MLCFVTCTNNNEEDLYGCQANKSTYTSLKPIFENNCAACHNNQVVNKGIKLNTYDNVKQTAISGKLLKVITHAPGVVPMPYGGQKLPDCEIESISSWINRGMPEN